MATEPNVLWETSLAREGLGGIAANHEVVVFGDRDFDDFQDAFRCLDAQTGEQRWVVERLAIAALDYGNSPRATPLIANGGAIFLGATGNLVCVDIASGNVVWEKALRDEFPIEAELPWGYCGSPLLVDGRLIVAPGAHNASLIALEPSTGDVLWKTPGPLPAYGSLNVATLGGKRQIVGHDHTTLGGWEIHSGKRLWTVEPEADGDFNVPTPLVHEGDLIVSTRNNGTRRFGFPAEDIASPQLIAHHRKLRPDMTTPVVVGDKLFCVRKFLYCLDLSDGLQEKWRVRDSALSDYASLMASDRRLLVVADGELLLLPTDGSQKFLGRMDLFDEKQAIYSHPALVGNRFYVRGKSKIMCVQF